MFLRLNIKNFHSDLYDHIIKLGISIEILFGQSLFCFGSDILNINTFFRIMDIAFN